MWLKSIGLGIAQGWLWLFFLNGPLLYNVTAKFGAKPGTVFLAFLLFSSISFLFIAKIGRIVSPLGKRSLLIILSVSLMTAGTLTAGFAAKDIYASSFNLLLTLGTLMSGFGSALLITAWGEQYSTLPANQASLSFGIAVTAGTVIFFIINRLPLPSGIIITALIPLLSGIILLRQANTVIEPEKPVLNRKPLSFPFPTRLVIFIVLFYLAGGLMYKIIASGQELGLYESFWLTNIVYFAVCLLAGGIVYFNPGLDLRFLFGPILPLLGIGFVLFPVLQNSYTVIPFTFLQAGFALFDLYTWVLFAYLAGRHRFPAAVIAWGMFLITSAILAGEHLFTGIFSKGSVSMKDIDLVSLVAALLMFLGTLVFRGERETFAGWDTPSDSLESDFFRSSRDFPASDEIACTSCEETNYDSITKEIQANVTKHNTKHIKTVGTGQELIPADSFALEHNLTPREKQILLLLL